mmetsp:Transcript_19472/g.47899  ORF Transcript_19472/g.47899 Transcript_19472/m.47899 type:complete len:135 (+) Transcript_19472:3-407(+)
MGPAEGCARFLVEGPPAMWGSVGRMARCRGTSVWARQMNSRMSTGNLTRVMASCHMERPLTGFAEQVIPADRCAGMLGCSGSLLTSGGLTEELLADAAAAVSQESCDLTRLLELAEIGIITIVEQNYVSTLASA